MSPGMLMDSRIIANLLTDKRDRNLDCGRVTAYTSSIPNFLCLASLP
jgi:hypothetical protein